MTLPVNIDSTYADSGTDASVKLHQQHHDTIHTFIDRTNTSVIYAADQGAKGDGVLGRTGGITTGTAVFTDANAAFTSADVGKTIIVNGAGASGNALKTTILTYTSATQVTLNANASTTVASGYYGYGTDDTAAIQAAVDAAAALLTGKVTVVLEDAIYIVAGALVTTSGYNAQITLPNVGTGSNKLGIKITSRTPDLEMTPYDGTGALTRQGCTILTSLGSGSPAAFSSTVGVASVIGGPATGKTSPAWTNIHVKVSGITVLWPHLPYGFGVDAGNCLQAEITYNRFATNETFNNQANPARMSGGFIMPQVNNDAVSVHDRNEVHGHTYGFLAGEHTKFGWFLAYQCVVGIGIASTAGSHSLYGSFYDSEHVIYHIGGVDTSFSGASTSITNALAFVIDLWNMEDASSGTWQTTYHVQDGSNLLLLDANILRAVAGTGAVLAGQSGNFKVNGGGGGMNIRDLAFGVGHVNAATVPASNTSTVVKNTGAGQVWRPCLIVISGGTVTDITLDTSSTGLTSGSFVVPSNHTYKITYSAAPTIQAWAL